MVMTTIEVMAVMVVDVVGVCCCLGHLKMSKERTRLTAEAVVFEPIDCLWLVVSTAQGYFTSNRINESWIESECRGYGPCSGQADKL